MSREFFIPKKVFMGAGSVEAAADSIKTLGKKALIVTGKIVVTLDVFNDVTSMLDSIDTEYEVFCEITGEPTDTMINAGALAYKEANCDFLIGIGGGSPIDAVKAIGVLVNGGGVISDYMGKNIDIKIPPIVAVPTTAGTGSEATQFTVITDTATDIKMLLKGAVLMPDIAVVDYRYTKSSSKIITASTGLDALTHAVESYTSKKAQSLTDTVAISAVKRIMKYLPLCYSDGENDKAREEMAVAAFEAGIAINNASVTIVHGMSRPIGALFHVPHGMSNAMLLEKCMEFAADGAVQRFAELARATGTEADMPDAEAALDFIKKLGKICRICEVPTLEEYGIDKEKFFACAPKMAKDAIASGSPANTKKEVTEKDVMDIYAKLWR